MLISRNHFRELRMESLVVVFVVASVFLRGSYAGTIIAKSDITVCDNYGKNPHNIVDNKSCQKKLIVTQSVLSSQDGTETLYFTTNKIYDHVEQEDARLYYPLILKISKSTVNLVYPFHYITTVNNHPYEEIRTDVRCSDAFHANEQTCGFARDDKGNKIWDSQGFCCQCSFYDSVPNWLRKIVYGGHLERYYRGGQGGICGYSHKSDDNDKYAHCLRMDELWYDVFGIGDYRMSFVIDIQAYELVEKIVNNKTKTEWLDGGKISLNFNKRSAVGQYGRLIATFHGTFAVTKEFQTLRDHYFLLIPRVKDDNMRNHRQIQNGFRDNMIIPAHKINLDPLSLDSCDKVGVSYTSFRKQGGGSNAVGPGCEQKQDSCLSNQPKDLFTEDLARREAGYRPEYFVERYGNCIGVNKKGLAENLGIVYKLDETITSLLTLEVSADDMMVIYNRASGIIVKASATNFDALSRDGQMTIMVQNTGLVTANFYVTFASCSEGVHLNVERTASINPQAIHVFKFDISVYQEKGQRHYCSIELYDARRQLQDSKNVSFMTYTPCVCLQHCACKCNTIAADENDDLSDDSGDVCDDLDDVDDDTDNDDEDEEKSGESIPTRIFDKITKIIDRRLLFLLLLLVLGFAKAMLGRQSLFIAKLGLGGLRTGEKVTKIIDGEEITLVYNASMDLTDPETKTTVIRNRPTRDFNVNIFFFILLPILVVIKIGKIAKPYMVFKRKLADEQLPIYAQQESPEVASEGVPKSKRIVLKKPLNARKMKGFPKLTANVPKLKASPKKVGKVR